MPDPGSGANQIFASACLLGLLYRDRSQDYLGYGPSDVIKFNWGDMKTNLYLTKRGSSISYKSSRVIVQSGDLVQELPIESIASIQIFVETQIDSALAKQCFKKDIPIYYISPKGKYLGKLQSLQNANVEARLSQYRGYFDTDQKAQITRQIILGKIKNSLTMLY
ncbi:MAG TPA: CRISPR-associated endonuclease Cas1, partial [Candidatus Wirthbacteria bacterium]|nr:CRISPR-associated endonuclease Cas1 [Candidatus Wirthbacteria bacterium]